MSTGIRGSNLCNLEKFISIIHNFCLLNLPLILKHEWHCDVRICVYCRVSDFLACYFLKQLFCFHIMPYYGSLSRSHIWIIDKLDTQRNGFFMNVL
jgi:hypothetical protein